MMLSGVAYDSFIKVGDAYYRPCLWGSSRGGDGGGVDGGGDGSAAGADKVARGMSPREVVDVVEHVKWVLEQTELDFCEVLLRQTLRNRPRGGLCLDLLTRPVPHECSRFLFFTGASYFHTPFLPPCLPFVPHVLPCSSLKPCRPLLPLIARALFRVKRRQSQAAAFNVRARAGE